MSAQSTGALAAIPTATPIDHRSFPEGREGPVSGTNGLARLNYFDGRHLTAAAMHREQYYWDARTRLAAQIHPAGVAWGMRLTAMRVGAAAAPEYELTDVLELHPGVAFDGAGRPIVVGAATRFTFDDLIDRFRAQPQVVQRGTARFAACPKVAPLPAGAAFDTSGLLDGAYLVVIRAEERLEGESKVYGVACPDPRAAPCAADVWRGGFGVSLVRFPVDLSDAQRAMDGWHLRGLLSSYYFDVWEHDLRARWGAGWAESPGSWSGPGPDERPAGPVALAMVYVRTGKVMFFCEWLARRTLPASLAQSNHANAMGAPTPASRAARTHRFQTHLAESLAAAPMPTSYPAAAPGPNLLERGFDCIPPSGFLPTGAPPGVDPFTLDRRTEVGLKVAHAWMAHARLAARAYFAGTNVATFATVAALDDDLLEDLAAVDNKDAIPLANRTTNPKLVDLLDAVDVLQPPDPQANYPRRGGWRSEPMRNLLQHLLHNKVDISDGLWNREFAIARLIIPLEPLRREFPVVGPTNPTGGLPTRPRSFVVYVKERASVVDYTLMGLEAILTHHSVMFTAVFWDRWDAASRQYPNDAATAIAKLESASTVNTAVAAYLQALLGLLGDAALYRFMDEAEEVAARWPN